MVELENEQLKISVNNHGAELNNLYSKMTDREYLWDGDAKFWNRKSPVLFPIVGQLKQNTYYYEGKVYKMGRHGFARDMVFQQTAISASSVTMTLESNETTYLNYPFHFRLNIQYTLDHDKLVIDYGVINTGEQNMYFSIGAHPAFRLPLEENMSFEDYYFELEHVEDANRWQISPEGLIEAPTVPLIINSDKLQITRELFSRDAVVFKYLNSTRIKLKSDKSKHGIEISYPRFPFLGLWEAPGADFICIEPWCGIADSTTHDQQLINKEGINLLTPGFVFKRSWTIRPF